MYLLPLLVSAGVFSPPGLGSFVSSRPALFAGTHQENFVACMQSFEAPIIWNLAVLARLRYLHKRVEQGACGGVQGRERGRGCRESRDERGNTSGKGRWDAADRRRMASDRANKQGLLTCR